MNWYSNDKISLILLRGMVAFAVVFVLAKVFNSSHDVVVLSLPLLLTFFNLLSYFRDKR